MNYRHAFHAGNLADVFKHAILVALLRALQAKPAALCFVDTHAGAGMYALGSAEASATGEYREGIARLLASRALPSSLVDYTTLVRTLPGNAAGELTEYPGSPLIAARLLREQDRAILCELQAPEATHLRRALHGDRRFAIHHRDGYAALGALLPPEQKRGLVLIDPPYEEQAREFERIQSALAQGFARWPNASFAVWYPVKLEGQLAPFRRWIAAHARSALDAELLVHPANSPLRLNGCGMVIANPPWQFEKQLAAILPAVQELLAVVGAGSHRLQWLAERV